VTLNVDHPAFFEKLNRCSQRNFKLKAIADSDTPAPVKFLRKLPHWLGTTGDLISLFLMKTVDAEATRSQVC
jgi:magnesium-protoporphyrin IX monomethyl ester (oxidative) cyclase